VTIILRLEKSASLQRGVSIITVSCAGTSTASVMRSRSIASMVARGSNFACSTTLAPAWNAGVVWMLSPPT